MRNGQVLDLRLASTKIPTVTVTFPNGGELLTGSLTTLRWDADDLDGNALTYIVQYSNDGGTTG